MKKLKIGFLVAGIVLLVVLFGYRSNTSKSINYGSFDIQKMALTPPMGWNSWDVFGTDVTEEEVKLMTDYMAENLKSVGYEYIVIDLGWYGPHITAVNEQYKQPYPEQIIDEYGRLLPASNRFPSCKDGSFKPVADYIHAKGLKFGIHVMRGIPRQAVEQNTPVKGTRYRARDIVMYEKSCTFYDGLLSIDMTKPGAQEYYNSLIELYTEWGVDFIKADDMTSYPHKLDEVKAFRYAIEEVNPSIVLSLSPGAVNSWDRSFLYHYADMYRISGDFWDTWTSLKNMFGRCRVFKGHTGPGGWADCDMIPLGIINIRGEHGEGERMTRFTPDEQYTLMTLWSIFRSPIMLGMDLTRLDPFTLSLITNPEVIRINQTSVNNDEVLTQDDWIVWAADSPDGKEKYIAVFNTGDEPGQFELDFNALGIQAYQSMRDVWTGVGLPVQSKVPLKINPHACRYLAVKL
jgi:alpha-galactosidase